VCPSRRRRSWTASWAADVTWPNALATAIKAVLVLAVLHVAGRVVYKFTDNPRPKSRLAGVRSGLRNLDMFEEAFRADSGRWALREEIPDTLLWSGGTELMAYEASDSGWSAVAQHPADRRPCAIFVGRIEPPPPATEEQVMACVPPSRLRRFARWLFQ